MCEAHDISRRSKTNNESSQEIQMLITFHSDVRFKCIIYQTLKIEHESARQIQTAITFDSGA